MRNLIFFIITIFSFSFKGLNSCTNKYDFIFAGPPYGLTTIDELPIKIFEKNMLKPGGRFVLEHTPRNDYRKYEHYVRERNYGTTIFSTFISFDDLPVNNEV